MMPIEQQVCSLDLAKRLKELGVKQDAHFCWVLAISGNWDRVVAKNILDPRWQRVYAFTVAELGKLLPCEIDYHPLQFRKFSDGWMGVYRNGNLQLRPPVMGKTEADCRASLLINLIEEGLVKP